MTDESALLSSDNDINPTTDGLWANSTEGANNSLEASEDDFYRHSPVVTTIYCLACKSTRGAINYPSSPDSRISCKKNKNNQIKWPICFTICYRIADTSVFLLGLVGNCLVVAVVFRAPRMRTVTNYFIVMKFPPSFNRLCLCTRAHTPLYIYNPFILFDRLIWLLPTSSSSFSAYQPHCCPTFSCVSTTVILYIVV